MTEQDADAHGDATDAAAAGEAGDDGESDATGGEPAGDGDEPDDEADPPAADREIGAAEDLTHDAFLDAVEAVGRSVVTAGDVARALDCSQAVASDGLDALADDGDVERLAVEGETVVYYPADVDALADRERLVVFPDRREIVADQPDQYTRARLSQFAHLADASGEGSYVYELRSEDVWAAPYDSLTELLAAIRTVLPDRYPGLEEWIEDQWKRAHKFRLTTHEDGYTVLEAESEHLMADVARQQLDDDQLRGPISETESWVNEAAVAEVKRVLYEAGYPVQDDRDLESGESLDVELTATLRDYQESWVEDFLEMGAGVLVGPPGSGKTVAATAGLTEIGGETLILVPGRELAAQWREELLDTTTLTDDQIGEYHGGTKEIRPVTIATYQTAGMDRHRRLFDDREWGLIVFDEVHHVPSPVFRRSTSLQSKYRLGTSATPVREDDRESDIFTLIGPPIGTDWSALFDRGFVAEPTVEIRYVPWDDELARSEYVTAEGSERRQVAATNPAKERELADLLAAHDDDQVLVFVDYLDQGEAFADAFDLPFISGETRHARRQRLLREFREGDRDALILSRVGDEGIDLPNADVAIVASGLGGSRRQGAQRAGRTMRPVGGARMYVLATQGTVEEEFARRQTHHLAEKGIRVRETGADAVEEPDGD